MATSVTKQRYATTLYRSIKSQIVRILVGMITLNEYLDSHIVVQNIKYIFKMCMKIFRRVFRTLYWLFAPNIVMQLPFRHMVLFCIMFAVPPIIRYTLDPLWTFIRQQIILRFTRDSDWVNKYIQTQQQCDKSSTYSDYVKWGSKLDEMEGYDGWRVMRKTTLYSYNKIHEDLIQLAQIRQKCDRFPFMTNSAISCSTLQHPIRDLMQFVRDRMRRDYCGINNPKLYQVRVGTKQLIEHFIDNICQSLHYIANYHENVLSLEEKTIYFQELRHLLGRTALCLSGGAGLGYYHIGVVIALAQNNLLPKVITGASAGSVIAALTCCRLERNVYDMLELDMKIYEEKEHRAWYQVVATRCSRFWNTGYFLDAKVGRDYMRANIGDMTFLEAHKKTGRILNIAVHGMETNTMPRVLNFLTAPNVVIWSACAASCAAPLFFEAQELYIKNPYTDKIEAIYLEGVKFNDGTMYADLPMDRIAQLFNVNDFIVSQVNPHMVPFLFHSMIAPLPLFGKLLKFLGQEFHLYLSTILVNVGGIRVFNDALTQKWTGDVTVVPNIPGSDFLNVLTNPTIRFIQRVARSGSKATFKHISRVQALCAAECTIDQCLDNMISQNMNTKVRTPEPSFSDLVRVPSWKGGVYRKEYQPIGFNRDTHDTDYFDYFGSSLSDIHVDIQRDPFVI